MREKIFFNKIRQKYLNIVVQNLCDKYHILGGEDFSHGTDVSVQLTGQNTGATIFSNNFSRKFKNIFLNTGAKIFLDNISRKFENIFLNTGAKNFFSCLYIPLYNRYQCSAHCSFFILFDVHSSSCFEPSADGR